MVDEDYKGSVFISYSTDDIDLVNKLCKLFRGIHIKTWQASVDLFRGDGKAWKKDVIKGIKNSQAIIPIYTRNSINRPWVLYELGAADVRDLPKYPVRTSEISIEEIKRFIPGEEVQVYNLFDREALTELFTNIICLQFGSTVNETNKDTARKLVIQYLKDNLIADEIINKATTRWIFIAGNIPRISSSETTNTIKSISENEFNTKVPQLLSTLTEQLLEADFSIMTCPHVKSVGQIVTQKTLSWIGRKKKPLRFQLGGIYPVDEVLRNLNIDPSYKSIFQDRLKDFRKGYMQNQEWLLIIGGNEGTQDEYEAAVEKNIMIMPLPCFGGIGAQLYQQYENLRRLPCTKCIKKDGNCTSDDIKTLISIFKNRGRNDP
jgi:hypothetical protein